MKVRFRYSGLGIEHTVRDSTKDYYILDSHPKNWSSDCFVAVKRDAVDIVEETIYKYGQKFKVGASGQIVVLVLIASNTYKLIDLSGNRWSENEIESNVGGLTFSQIKQLAGEHYKVEVVT